MSTFDSRVQRLSMKVKVGGTVSWFIEWGNEVEKKIEVLVTTVEREEKKERAEQSETQWWREQKYEYEERL